MSALTLRCSWPASANLKTAGLGQHHVQSIVSLQSHRSVRRGSIGRRLSVAVKAASAEPLTVFSPSKINLFLRVMKRREDGYHDLASLFHVIDLGDTLVFEPLAGAEEDRLTCNMEGVPTDKSNLVIKALDLFRRKTGTSNYYSIALEKVVPHGAGLGGGSGNAAATMWAANELSGRPATDQQLLEWSGEIGSDISVFFSNGAAYCTGRGEVVEDVRPPLPLDTPLLLVKPPEGLSTPEVFHALNLDSRSTADPLNLLARLGEGRVTPDLCVNDLEPPAFSKIAASRALRSGLVCRRQSRNFCNEVIWEKGLRYVGATEEDLNHAWVNFLLRAGWMPSLAALKERLIQEGNFTAVFMSGSGSTIVCVGSDESPAFLKEPQYQGLFVAPARLIARQPGEWYQPTTPALANVAA